MPREQAFDVLIVGGGPAGIAAATMYPAHSVCRCQRHTECAGYNGVPPTVGIVDDNPTPGGQIWRGGSASADTRQAKMWLDRLAKTNVTFLPGTQVTHQPGPGVLAAETPEGGWVLRYGKLIIATGARERFLPFSGWTLPGVTGAGGLQALAHGGLSIAGKRVVVAGSGPLLLAVAAHLRRQGAEIRLIAEQAPWKRLLGFGLSLLHLGPGKLIQGAGYQWDLLGVRYLTNCWPVAAEGDGQLAAVTLRHGDKQWSAPCDYLACGFGFAPSLELPALLGCRIEDGRVWVDPYQETSVPGVYCAGEPTGIGGVDQALVEGQIAGLAAAGRRDEAAKLFAARNRAHRFARALDRAFALRDELRALAASDTIVCRCEDVAHGRLRRFDSWRAAKLHTRCGMGACQGRVCGGAAEFLYGWKHESVRPPVFPARIENL